MPQGQLIDLHTGLKVTIVGFVAVDDKKGVTLTNGFDENGNYAGNFFIPKSCITKIRKVRY